MVRQGQVVKIAEDVYLPAVIYEKARELIIDFLRKNKEISVAQTRDLLQTSRKYALPLLDSLDRERVTRRVGDNRVLIQG